MTEGKWDGNDREVGRGVSSNDEEKSTSFLKILSRLKANLRAAKRAKRNQAEGREKDQEKFKATLKTFAWIHVTRAA